MLNQDVIDELYQLSTNRDLCFRLLGRTVPAGYYEPNQLNPKILPISLDIRSVFDKVLAASSTNEDASIKLLFEELTNIKKPHPFGQTLFGEMILLYTCVGSADCTPCRIILLEQIVRLSKSQGGRSAREWMTLMIEYLGCVKDEDLPASSVNEAIYALAEQRAALTGGPFTTRPGLVGEAFVGYGLAAEQKGDLAKAKQCLLGVFKDLDYVGKGHTLPTNLRWELTAIYYWFEQACEGLLRLDPDNLNIKRKLQEVQDFRHNKKLPDSPSLPQVGPIMEVYLQRAPYLAKLLQELQQQAGDETGLFRVAHRFDYCREIDFYQSAMGSYYSARPLLESMGVSATYDAAHREVFDALDLIKTAEN